MNCVPVDLPPIPEHLIEDLEIIETREDFFVQSVKDYEDTYASRAANQDLIDYLESQFDYPIKVRYQIIKKELPVHVDHAPQPTKLNYMIDPVGPVKTQFWSSVDDPKHMIEEVELQPRTWYRLNISTPHSITQPERPRISVTIKDMTPNV